ncbi:MAG: hypothetical protein IJN05_01955 [Ruminococcus sp.]|nr:hypothetical protein [Ruminococcus sp.]
MKKLSCEMCGSVDLIKENGVFVCQFCGCKYSVEEAKKMMIDGNVDVSGSVVKVDTSDELKNLYELARRAKDDNNVECAYQFYSQIVVKDPSSWEAYFYTNYYQSVNCIIAEIGVAAVRISDCQETVFNLIKNYVDNPDEQRMAVNEVAERLIIISDVLYDAYRRYYSSIDLQIKSNYIQSYLDNCSAARDIAYNAGNYIIKVFGDTYGDIAAACWEFAVTKHNQLNFFFKNKRINAEIMKGYCDKIIKYNPSYQPPKINDRNSGCYIATAVYGSYDCPQVWTLRRFRDGTLAKTWYGKLFIKVYYAISPMFVKWFGHTNWFKNFWKRKLDRLVLNLNTKGVEDTPYEDNLM